MEEEELQIIDRAITDFHLIKDDSGFGLLHVVVIHNQFDAIPLLLSNGFDI